MLLCETDVVNNSIFFTPVDNIQSVLKRLCYCYYKD